MDKRFLALGIVFAIVLFGFAYYSVQANPVLKFQTTQWFAENQGFIYLLLISFLVIAFIAFLRAPATLLVKPIQISEGLQLALEKSHWRDQERLSWLLESPYFARTDDFARETFLETGMYQVRFAPVRVPPASCPFQDGAVFVKLYAYAGMFPKGGSPLAGITHVNRDMVYNRSRKQSNILLEWGGYVSREERMASIALEQPDRPVQFLQSSQEKPGGASP